MLTYPIRMCKFFFFGAWQLKIDCVKWHTAVDL